MMPFRAGGKQLGLLLLLLLLVLFREIAAQKRNLKEIRDIYKTC